MPVGGNGRTRLHRSARQCVPCPAEHNTTGVAPGSQLETAGLGYGGDAAVHGKRDERPSSPAPASTLGTGRGAHLDCSTSQTCGRTCGAMNELDQGSEDIDELMDVDG